MVAGPKGATAAPGSEAAGMDAWAGFVRVPAGKGCMLLLTPAEYRRAVRRGKWLRRAEAVRRREAGGR
jgi:hypothetical protein